MHGAIICESLRPGTTIAIDGMTITRVSRYDVGGVPDYQPPTWTLIEFDAPDEQSHSLADQLQAALLTPGWYANWNTEDEATVVFADAIFRYPRGDPGGRAAAQAHGRERGVPEPQLDWED